MRPAPGRPGPRSAHDAAGVHLHHPAAAGRHVRHGGLDPLARLGGRHGGAGEGRQRVRRGGGGGPGAPGRRAAPERARRRGAGDRLRRRPAARRSCWTARGPRRPPPRSRRSARSGLDLVPGNGLLAAMRARGVRHLDAAARRYGTLPLREVMEYAIGYARDGYPMRARASAAIDAVAGAFREHWPTSAEIYLADGVPAPGARFANPALAATYQPRPGRGRGGGRGPGGADRGGPAGLVRGLRGRGDRAPTWRSAEVMDVTGERHRGLLDRRRPGRPGGPARRRRSRRVPRA